MFEDARSRFGDARRGAPTASRHAMLRPMEQCRQTEILRFNSKIHCEVTEVISIHFNKCHENMCIFFHLIDGFLKKTNPFAIFVGVMSEGITWINCCLYLAWSPHALA